MSLMHCFGSGHGAPVTELAIRAVKEDVDEETFLNARNTFVSLLSQQPGVETDREFRPFFNYVTFTSPVENPTVFIGMTRYQDLSDANAASVAIGSSPEALAFLALFDPLVFAMLEPPRCDIASDLNKSVCWW